MTMVEVGTGLMGACCCAPHYSVLPVGPSCFPLGIPFSYFPFTLGDSCSSLFSVVLLPHLSSSSPA